MLVAIVSFVLAADGAPVGEPQNIGGYRVTLLAVRELSESDLVTKDGRPAPGGRRLWWLVEPPDGSVEPPKLGDVRLSMGGKRYNEVTSPTSTKPFAPDLVVRDYKDAAGLVPMPKLPPRFGSVLAEVIVRGRELKPSATGTAELQVLGKRTIWVRARIVQ